MSSQPQPAQHHPTAEAVVKPPDHKTISFLKTSLDANATYTLVKPGLTCYLSIIKARVQCPCLVPSASLVPVRGVEVGQRHARAREPGGLGREG